MEMKICVSVCELAQRLDNFEDYLDNSSEYQQAGIICFIAL